MSKPQIKVSNVLIKRIVETDPDLSYLGEYSSSDQTRHADEIAIDRKANGDYRDGEYRFFIAANVENEKQAQENYERQQQYDNGEIVDYGIIAEASIAVPNEYTNAKDGAHSFTMQKISSGGLWGNSSDFSESELKEVEDEQIEDLKQQLRALRIPIPKDLVIVRRTE